MLHLGQMNQLRVVETSFDGFFLEGEEFESLLLPKSEAPEGLEVDDLLDVFVYRDSVEHVVATTATPTAQVGETVFLELLSVNDHGAFFDWGLPKDLFMPYAEQAYPMTVGNSYVVYVYLDERSGRVACSTKLHNHLAETSVYLKSGNQVDLLIYGKSKMGFKAVINDSCLGLIFHETLGQPLVLGDRMKGWVKSIREDGKIDLTVNALDSETRDQLEQDILAKLNQEGGRLMLSDKSSPEEVFAAFKVSKKNFKRAISSLYKQRIIRIDPHYIELV